ncbi:hypothetical protein [Pseudomonas gessardii]|uniref:Lipoprotein n=2 Tax=Pseudomonas gessardii TaxID=78544 RepID=A0ABS9FHN7_9PSED|nr:hypothetical protein [Pseudomonas gessardii]MCF4981745.1 hypothetical protein [Pseudomonas gessardii]MCF5110917.1 hypothetical protein [Pseudomonas gessardii]NNA69767.1 hypothetical protein [Pseudomonas gessardii]NNA91834.1 hypothetical protein [Pseudomonas gessardii]
MSPQEMEFNPSSSSRWLLALFGASLLSLSGCQSQTPEQAAASAAEQALEQQKYEKFTTTFQTILRSYALAANEQGLTGVMNLIMTVDAQNHVVDCSVKRGTLLPNMSQNNLRQAKLAQLVTELCWTTLFPEVSPKAFTDAKDTQVIVAPMVFSPMIGLSEEQQRWQNQRVDLYRQIRFFREQLFIGHDVQSIGVASFHLIADAQGKVSECMVNLNQSPYRSQGFKVDSALQQRLVTQCKRLDLRQMPGFANYPQGLPLGYVQVDYSPWMNGRSATK